MNHYVIITAAGKGERMNSSTPKQFHSLSKTSVIEEDKLITQESKPILLWTIEKFLSLDIDVKIILVLPNSYIEQWKEYYITNNLYFEHIIVAGGLTRFHSVRAALEKVPEGAVVAIHDGVRPFVSKGLIERLMKWEFKGNVAGVIPVLSSYDSIRKRCGDKTVSVVREDYMLVQTPQVFLSSKIKEAYSKPYSPEYTDDASVLVASGSDIDFAEGERLNIKITTPDDMRSAQIIMRSI